MSSEKRFINHLSPRPYCSYNKEGPYSIGKRDNAIKTARYIHLPTQRRNYVILDLDYYAAGSKWLDVGILQPTCIIVNPENLHAKYLFELNNPIILPLQNRTIEISYKAIKFYHAVKMGLDMAFNGDPGYQGCNLNNPFHTEWHVIWSNNTFDLNYLNEYTAPIDKKKFYQNKDAINEGRERMMFDVCRQWAYHEVKNFTNYDSFKYHVENYVLSYYYNVASKIKKDHELRITEAYNVSRSISRWIWKHKDDENFKRFLWNTGAMNFEPIDYTNLSPEDAQKEITARKTQGAIHSHSKSNEKSRGKIRAAMIYIKENNFKLSRNYLSELTGLNVKTITRHGNYILEIKKELELD